MLRSQFLGQTVATATPVTESAASTSSVKITALFKRKAATVAKKVKKVVSPADIELAKWYGESPGGTLSRIMVYLTSYTMVFGITALPKW